MIKKILAAFAAALLGAGVLVGFSGSAAQAKDCPYTGCLNTNTDIEGPAVIKRKAQAEFNIHVTSGNARPRGTIKFVVRHNKGGFYRARTFRYRGKPRTALTPPLKKKGWYTVKAIYRPGANQPFNASREAVQLKVRRRG